MVLLPKQLSPVYYTAEFCEDIVSFIHLPTSGCKFTKLLLLCCLDLSLVSRTMLLYLCFAIKVTCNIFLFLNRMIFCKIFTFWFITEAFDYNFVKVVGQHCVLPRILCRGYDYIRQKCGPDHVNKYWRCSLYLTRKCRARAILNADGCISLKSAHNHAPQAAEKFAPVALGHTIQ